MANSYYVLSSMTTDRHTDWTSGVTFAGDDGEVKTVMVGVPVRLSSSEAETIKELGFQLDRSTAAKAEEVEQSGQPLVSPDESKSSTEKEVS